MGLRTFIPVGGLLWYKCSPVCESPTQQLWDLIYCDCTPPTISLWLLLCLRMCGIFYGEFQRLPVDDCSAVSCDSSALARGNESTSFYSATLNQSTTLFIIAKIWKQPKCPSMDEWIKKMVHTHTHTHTHRERKWNITQS